MIFLLWICIGFLALYVLLMLVYSMGWLSQKEFRANEFFVPEIKISVVVAARNEAENIQRCISSILAQNYPAHLLELIIVDDHSEDDTAEIVLQSDRVKMIALKDFVAAGEQVVSFKKKALETGIRASSGQLIVTTDADCWMEKNWLRNIAAFHEKTAAKMIVAPVQFSSAYTFLKLFQSLDFMTMQGITQATIQLRLGIMCNGANLIFERTAFDAVNGYDGVSQIISGDDYLLLMKIKQEYPKGIQYLKSKEAVVYTKAQETWSAFLQQRIRWASKSGKYKDHLMNGVLLLVYTLNVSIFFFGIAAIISPALCSPFLIILAIKILSEMIFLLPVAHFYRNKTELIFFPFLQPFHIFYIIVAGFLSRMGKFEWKTRINIQQ